MTPDKFWIDEFGTFTEQMWCDLGKNALHNNETMRPAGEEVSKITGVRQIESYDFVAAHKRFVEDYKDGIYDLSPV